MLTNGLRRTTKSILFFLISTIVLLNIILIFSYFFRQFRQITIVAETEFVRIEVSGNSNYWVLPDKVGDLTFNAGDIIELTSEVDLYRLVLSRGGDKHRRTFADIEVKSLPFDGYVRVGKSPLSDAHLTQNGNYKVSEILPVQWFFGFRPETIYSGDFLKGDVVDVVTSVQKRSQCDGSPEVESTGFLSLRNNRIEVYATSILSNSSVRIRRGAAQKSCIHPNWIDVALRDPLLLAVSTALAFCVAVLTAFREVISIQ